MLAKGFVCTGCEKTHLFHPYVYAHWDIALFHTCDVCSTIHRALRGKVSTGKTRAKRITADGEVK